MTKLTIADIAARAGVSKTTVSRVLNDRPEGVSDATRARIVQLVAETGYQPSAVARSLATGASRSVALMIPDITNPFFAALVCGAERTLYEAGYSLLLANSDRSLEKEISTLRVLLDKGVDGVILDSAASDSDVQIEAIEARGIPVVLLDRTTPSWKTKYGVYTDNRDGARQAVRHLLRNGACRLVYVNGPEKLSQSIDRRLGLEDVLAERGMSTIDLTILDGEFTLEGAYARMSEVLSGSAATKAAPLAVFAANDVMAIGAMRALKEHGMSVPADVEVIGFDDIELARMIEPALSTVAQPALEMGTLSAELLLRLVRGESPRVKRRVLAPTLRLRATTRPS